jgi:hypothetical protein
MPAASPSELIEDTRKEFESAIQENADITTTSREKRKLRARPMSRQLLHQYFRTKKDGRSLLRPRYLQVTSQSIMVFPRNINPQTTAVLAESGGPYINKQFSVGWTAALLQPCEFYPEGYKRGFTVSATDQWNMSHLFFRTPPKAGVYLVNAAVRTFSVRQFIFAMEVHATQSLGARNVKWVGLYGGYRNDLLDDPKPLDLLIIGNVHEGLDPVKFGKLRDILHYYRDTPTILVCDGIDPLDFALGKLRTVPKMVLNIATPRLDKIEKYIRIV